MYMYMWHLYCIHDLALIGRNTTCHSRDMSVLRVSIALLYPRLGLYCIHHLASTVSTTWPLLRVSFVSIACQYCDMCSIAVSLLYVPICMYVYMYAYMYVYTYM